jgi:signal transduction histidine kinase
MHVEAAAGSPSAGGEATVGPLLARLAAGVTHELRSPLAVILARVQLLDLALRSGRPLTPERIRETLGTVQEQALRASRVLETFAAFARPRPPRRTAVDVRRTIDAALAEVRDRIAVGGALAVEVDVAPDAGTVSADGDQLATALAHLVRNAVEAMPDGGRVRIAARRAPGVVHITVSDTGAGVPVDDAPRIFEPFFSTKRSAAGLGLAVVRGIAAAHGGAVHLAAAGGPGAEFVLALPDPEPSA